MVFYCIESYEHDGQTPPFPPNNSYPTIIVSLPCDPISLVTAVECGHKSLDTRTTHALVTHPLKERLVTQDVNHHNLGH
eukprot:scaffold11653_cov123-Skeletonema_menzelii.AAC.2